MKKQRKLLVTAIAAVLFTPPFAALAQSNDANISSEGKKTSTLESITVTGSLIPQTEVETSTPITTITASDLKAKGFATVADALQQSSFATGGAQGSQSSGGFTPGAQTLSMFGLPVGFVKYLIDGRPMGNFPGLYNGSDVFNNLSGIPTELVERIEILPGGQSSLYGSDAIAGVINIILKKKLDAPVVDVRYGWSQDGGGVDRRISLANSFQIGRLNIMGGVQFEKTQPIWGFDRELTAKANQNGTSAPVPSRDYLIYSATKTSNGYYMLDPNKCSQVNGQYQGTEGLQNRPNSGEYCGSMYSAGYRTLANDVKSAQGYTHVTFDVNDHVQLYGDLLYTYQEQKDTPGPSFTWWGTGSSYGAFYDPNLDDYVNLQRAFSPEEVGGYRSIMNRRIENAYMLTLGAKGRLGSSQWDYDASFTHSDDKLNERQFARFTKPMEAYFASHVLGPSLGVDPNGLDIFTPDYAAFYSPISTADFRSFTGYTSTRSKTWDNLWRAQLTNASLVKMPGGDAGIAVVLEGGNQGWNYAPDTRLLTGDVWGTSAIQGAGHRTRYAATTELRLPLLEQLTMNASVRYDAFDVAKQTVSKPTYSVGFEYRPTDFLMLRTKYGSAFKAPTLSDQFQGESGYYSTVTDYYNCALLGFGPGQAAQCPSKYNSVQYVGTQSGNSNLQPINAKVWSYGFVLAPVSRMAITVDYLHWGIKDEVAQQSADQLAQQEALCRLGALDINLPTCVAALDQVARDALGNITGIYTPKVNVAKEAVNAINANFDYSFGIGELGSLALNASYSNVLKHSYQPYPGDPTIDLLRSPNYSTDFKTKANASITWLRNAWSTTLYANRYGSTPNYIASLSNDYNTPGAGKLAPWIRYNASVSYNPAPDLTLSFLVNNLFNKMPPKDNSYPGTSTSPYNNENYNVFGRTFYVQATYKLGK
ncbi:TonB-dependent receptor domain-containing protein [Dyella subtropica]|uniref:TonB-dependent receptor domain-containing protein n=1 Tax=Dyella subtropica TaxID=2992127 RepID=UPI00224E4394|nr:TonB-dependent receptor [Dyella subtropica]